jgi:hypothetical protein
MYHGISNRSQANCTAKLRIDGIEMMCIKPDDHVLLGKLARYGESMSFHYDSINELYWTTDDNGDVTIQGMS